MLIIAPVMSVTALHCRSPQVPAAQIFISLKAVLQAENIARQGHKQVLRQGLNQIP